MKVTIEFSGGLELLFDKEKFHTKELPNKDSMSLKEFVLWIRDNMLKERPELFVVEGTVRPGILVLINDADWELMGGINSTIEDGDNVVFISTLHGG